MQIMSPFFFILTLYVMNEVLNGAAKEHLYEDRMYLPRASWQLVCLR
jgi:hypothetical protein